ncbi:MAG TPA: DUF2207 domain-containing protein [Terrimesophilobacter sp.]|nr:DUF2207 domain-containing protein [Terrimesophilobacter sp.]
MRTVETLVAVFPEFDQNRGIIRAIPNYYDGVPLETRVVSVIDEHGAAVHFEVIGSGELVELALGTDEFVHGRTTYVITYEQRNVVRSFADTDADEFYWDTNGTGWAQPFHTVAARVHVDSALTDLLTGEAACYSGALGEQGACELERVDEAQGALFVASAVELGPGENLTVAIAFERGTFVQVEPDPDAPGPGIPEEGFPFAPASPVAAWWIDVGSYASAAIVVLGTAFTIVWRFVRPRSSKGTGIIVPQYTAPKDVSVMESAELIGRRRYGVPAQIVSFAVRGHLRILDYPVTGSGARYSLQLLTAEGLDDHELSLVHALFGSTEPGALQEVGIVDDRAATAIAQVAGSVRQRVIDRGLLQTRSSAVGIIGAVVMFLMAFVTMGVFMLSVFFGNVNPWGIIGFMLAMVGIFVCLGFAWRPPVPTAEGVKREEYLLGIRDYLKLAEEERFRMLQSPEGALRVRAEGLDPTFPAQRVKLYERLLPFAVLWGVEREWANELAILYGGAAPDWFVSSGSFDGSSFSVALGSLSVSPVARSTPSSSSSSWSGSSGGSFSGGSSGGGFSGGGGGGGGGGGR